MKFKHGDILIDASDPEDNWELIFLYYEDYKDNNHYLNQLFAIKKISIDCVVGMFGTEDNITGMCSKNLWYKNGRHVLTEVCDV